MEVFGRHLRVVDTNIIYYSFFLFFKYRYQNVHDRFIVIDNKELYHVGASLKDLGKKCFAISKINDQEYIEKISKYG